MTRIVQMGTSNTTGFHMEIKHFSTASYGQVTLTSKSFLIYGKQLRISEFWTKLRHIVTYTEFQYIISGFKFYSKNNFISVNAPQFNKNERTECVLDHFCTLVDWESIGCVVTQTHDRGL